MTQEQKLKSFAVLVNEMIDIEAKESERPVKEILQEIANFYQVSEKYLIKNLKKINSIYTANNNIVGYIDGQPIKRTCAILQFIRVIKKIYKSLSIDDEDRIIVMKTIADIYPIYYKGRRINADCIN